MRKFSCGVRVSDHLMPDLTDVDPHLVIQDSGKVPRHRRRMFRALPYVDSSFVPITADSNDPETVIAGIQKRIGTLVPSTSLCKSEMTKDDRAKFEATGFRTFVRNYIAKNFQPLSTSTDVSFETWLNNCNNYSSVRKAELAGVWERTKGVVQKSAYKCKSHVKTEGYPEFKHCRIINSRKDEFKVFAGPYVKAMENEIYKNHHFIKHVPVPERHKLVQGLRAAMRVYVESDYKSFEGSFMPIFIDACENELYRHMLKNFPLAAYVLCKAAKGKNRGKFRNGIEFEIPGRRMSGDMFTSLANGFSNLMIWAYLMDKKGCQDWDGFVEGDDGIFALKREYVPEPSEYATFGFTIKLSCYDDPGEASFCGMTYADQGSMRDPHEFVQNFAWTHSCVGAREKILSRLLRAKALSAFYEMPTCPIVREYALYALRKTRGVTPLFTPDGYHDFTMVPTDEARLRVEPISLPTRLLFQKSYGISVAAQLESERLMGKDDVRAALNILRRPDPVARASNDFIEYA